jgi:hypothetical protein
VKWGLRARSSPDCRYSSHQKKKKKRKKEEEEKKSSYSQQIAQDALCRATEASGSKKARIAAPSRRESGVFGVRC